MGKIQTCTLVECCPLVQRQLCKVFAKHPMHCGSLGRRYLISTGRYTLTLSELNPAISRDTPTLLYLHSLRLLDGRWRMRKTLVFFPLPEYWAYALTWRSASLVWSLPSILSKGKVSLDLVLMSCWNVDLQGRGNFLLRVGASSLPPCWESDSWEDLQQTDEGPFWLCGDWPYRAPI